MFMEVICAKCSLFNVISGIAFYNFASKCFWKFHFFALVYYGFGAFSI